LVVNINFQVLDVLCESRQGKDTPPVSTEPENRTRGLRGRPVQQDRRDWLSRNTVYRLRLSDPGCHHHCSVGLHSNAHHLILIADIT
jgi:hypothetical protein